MPIATSRGTLHRTLVPSEAPTWQEGRVIAVDDVEELKGYFDANIARVESLIALYDRVGTPGRGAPSVAQTDVLRACVVMLHATLEDLIRSSSGYLLPLASAEILDEIGFPTSASGQAGTQSKATLGVLEPFRGQTVNDVIRHAVRARLQRSNYNNATEVSTALARIGVPTPPIAHHMATLEVMIRRRHLIVHRADNVPSRIPGRGIRRTEHLQKATIVSWTTTVRAVGNEIIEALCKMATGGEL